MCDNKINEPSNVVLRAENYIYRVYANHMPAALDDDTRCRRFNWSIRTEIFVACVSPRAFIPALRIILVKQTSGDTSQRKHVQDFLCIDFPGYLCRKPVISFPVSGYVRQY